MRSVNGRLRCTRSATEAAALCTISQLTPLRRLITMLTTLHKITRFAERKYDVCTRTATRHRAGYNFSTTARHHMLKFVEMKFTYLATLLQQFLERTVA